MEQSSFDRGLRHPDYVMDSLLQGMGATQVTAQQEVAGMDGIGDASIGVSMRLNLRGLPFQVDVALFRYDIVGCVIMVMYPQGTAPSISLEEVALKMDERVAEVLSFSPARSLSKRGDATVPGYHGTARLPAVSLSACAHAGP
jgi:hypothetical protein